jgi:long-subunit fatty acid transport protein
MDRWSAGATLRYNFFRYRYERGDSRTDFSDESPSINLGLLWYPHRLFQLGAVYKSIQKLEGPFEGGHLDTSLPDTYGVGLALFPSDSLRLAFDVDRIRWSKFDPNAGAIDTGDDFFKEDVWRYHTGGELLLGFWRNTAFFLRGGYMYEESNATRYRGENELFQALSTKHDPVDHYTLGFGIAQDRFQIDLGYDWTEDSGRDLIGSLVWYF